MSFRCDVGEVVTLAGVLGNVLSRREVAELLGLHQDSVSRALADGLGAAVVQWGGSGKTMTFSRLLVQRWQRARACTRRAGTPCADCALTLEDCEVVAVHLLEARHGVHESCGNWDECGYEWARPAVRRRKTA